MLILTQILFYENDNKVYDFSLSENYISNVMPKIKFYIKLMLIHKKTIYKRWLSCSSTKNYFTSAHAISTTCCEG